MSGTTKNTKKELNKILKSFDRTKNEVKELREKKPNNKNGLIEKREQLKEIETKLERTLSELKG